MTVDEAFDENGIRDDQLRMIFMCCHPTLSPENRVTLDTEDALRIGSAGHRAGAADDGSDGATSGCTGRASRFASVQFELPPTAELPAALDTVHTALYLLFNEGYFSTDRQADPAGAVPRRDAARRAAGGHPAIATSDTIALIALMCFNAARLESRAG